MRIKHVSHVTHAFGYCDLYVIDPEENTGGTGMGDTAYTKGFDAFVDGDPRDPRRIPPEQLGGDARVDWFRGWDAAQQIWKTLMRNRGK